MRTVAILLAAGSGDRLGAAGPKALVPLRDRPLLRYSLEAVSSSGVVGALLVVAPGSARADFESVVADTGLAVPVGSLVTGGATRQESVRAGLEALTGEADIVLCHDAARPLASANLFRRVVAELEKGHEAAGCIPVVPSADTVKLVEAGRIVRTVPRSQVGLAQTPQAFVLSVLREAHARAHRLGEEATDDAMLVEAAGYPVAAIEGEEQNFKITTPDDLRRAEQLLARTLGLQEGVSP
jgi:2-C-methyl-D-erythritol 4-phosphate cytidylyltransferase / 2-C-methyl-D-erythritol 2,4-cyclodiphosphate synthase